MHRHHVARGKTLHHARQQLRREVDLGHQQQHLPATRERTFGRAQIDLGLAAAGHAVQQQRRGTRHRRGGLDRVDSGRLLERQHRPQRFVGSITALGLRGAPRALQALRELGGIDAAQFGRQHVERQLAERALVVAGGEFHQRHPRLAQRRHRVEHLRNRTQRRLAGSDRTRRDLPHEAGDITPPQRHPHQRAGGQRPIVAVVQCLAQARVPRRLDHHLHPRGVMRLLLLRVHMQSWVSTIAR